MTRPLAFSKKYHTLILLILITAHSFLMNGYWLSRNDNTVATYISSIKAHVDPSLFKNSIYVQAVQRTNLRIGIFYDFSPLIYKYFDFETFAIVQAIVSLFFINWGIYTLAKLFFKNAFAGYLAALLYNVVLNNWTLGSPAPYFNYFHHGLQYSYPLILWSLVFFFTKRYPLSMFLAGVSWAFHTMGAAFLFPGYFLYWLCHLKEIKPRTIVASLLAFLVPALPFFIRSFDHIGLTSEVSHLWLEGIRWVMWFTCLPKTWPLFWIVRAGLFFFLFLLCFYQIRDKQVKSWIFIFMISIALMCILGTLFADVLYPSHFIIKTSLWRSTTIYLFLALPCIACAVLRIWGRSITRRFLSIALMVVLTGFLECFTPYYLAFFIVSAAYVLYEHQILKRIPYLQGKFPFLFFIMLSLCVCCQSLFDRLCIPLVVFILFVLGFLLIIRLLEKYNLSINPYVAAILFIMIFDISVLYYKGGPEIYYHGTIQGKRDPWADIQMYAREHSHKDDLFIVPPYMAGFTFYSLRATVGDWAEGTTLIYLDKQFTDEWFERMKDLGWRTSYAAKSGYNSLTTEAVAAAAQKYGAKFVVTEKPKTFALPLLYENEQFVLYRVFL